MNRRFSAILITTAVFIAANLATAFTPCQVPTVSDSQENPNHTFPVFAETYEVRILLGLPDLNILADMVQYHDNRVVNKSVISIVSAGQTTRFIYNSKNLLLNSIHLNQDGECWAESEEKLQAMVNSSYDGSPLPGWDTVLPPHYLLLPAIRPPAQFAYVQADTIRGISVDKWRTCLKDDESNLTYVVNYYISQSAVSTPSRIGRAPSIVRMTTNTESDLTAHSVVYDVIDFIPFIEDETIFQTLSTCESKDPCLDNGSFPNLYSKEKEGVEVSTKEANKEKPLPLYNTTNFGIITELAVNESKKLISWKEFYLYFSKIVLYEYSTPFNISYFNITFPKPYGSDPIREIHDFNTGYAYFLDLYTGQCSMTPIPTSFSEVEVTDDMKHVQLRNFSNLYFLSDSNITWSYVGKSVRRDIGCEFWEGKQVWNSTYEGVSIFTDITYLWHFSDDDWTTDMELTNVPIVLEINYTSSTGSYSTLNFNTFYYNNEVLGLEDFDVSACYSLSSKYSLAFVVEGTDLYEKYVIHSLNFFYFSARYAISQAAGITDIRVDNLFVDEPNHELTVWFTLLDKPSFEGDVANVEELDLSQAYAKLEETINKGQMNISYYVDDTVKALQVKIGSLKFDDNPNDPQAGTEDYSAADMGGLAFGMLVVGGLIGTALGFFIWKYNRGIGYKIYE